jgi:phage baseplate assembly protein W
VADASHVFGQDLTFGPTGDFATVDGADEGVQRVLRRLLTNPLGYIWRPDYGAGLPAFVGQPAQQDRIAAIARAQMFLEAAVAQTPAPVIAVTPYPNGTVSLSIAYTDAQSGDPVAVPTQTLA